MTRAVLGHDACEALSVRWTGEHWAAHEMVEHLSHDDNARFLLALIDHDVDASRPHPHPLHACRASGAAPTDIGDSRTDWATDRECSKTWL